MIQENYNHRIYKNGKLNLDATLKRALFFDKDGKIEVDGITAEIFNSSGETTTKIQADKGTVNKNDKNVVFNQNVKVESFEQKIKLFTDKLTLDYQNDKLIADENVLIEKEDGSFLKSDYFESEIRAMETKFNNLELQYFYNDENEKKEDDDEVND